MKTLKSVMIAALFTFSIVTYANSSSETKINNVGIETLDNISNLEQGRHFRTHLMFSQALKIDLLVKSMHEQLTCGFIRNERLKTYTASVKYQGGIVYITGSCHEWRSFFNDKIVKIAKTE